MLSNQHEQAVTLAVEAIKNSPSKARAHPLLFYVRGLGFLHKKKFQEAIDDFIWAKQSNKLLFPDIRFKLAIAYAKIQKRLMAVEELKELNHKFPGHLAGATFLINLLMQMGQMEEAQKYCMRIQKIYPKNSLLLRLEARMLMETGKIREAQAIYQKVIQLDSKGIAGNLGLVSVDMANKDFHSAVKRLSNPYC